MRKTMMVLAAAGVLGLGAAGMVMAQPGPGGGPGGPPWMQGQGGWGGGHGGWGMGNPERMIERMERRLQRGFDHFDRNLDGAVEVGEVRAVMGRLFERLDRDGDGALTRADLEAGLATRMGGRLPPERRAEVQNRMVERVLGRFGKPADGRVTREEFAAQFEPVLRYMDRNGDGRVSRQEVEEVLAFMAMLRR